MAARTDQWVECEGTAPQEEPQAATGSIVARIEPVEPARTRPGRAPRLSSRLSAARTRAPPARGPPPYHAGPSRARAGVGAAPLSIRRPAARAAQPPSVRGAEGACAINGGAKSPSPTGGTEARRACWTG